MVEGTLMLVFISESLSYPRFHLKGDSAETIGYYQNINRDIVKTLGFSRVSLEGKGEVEGTLMPMFLQQSPFPIRGYI